jgi:hypothetical protein
VSLSAIPALPFNGNYGKQKKGDEKKRDAKKVESRGGAVV